MSFLKSFKTALGFSSSEFEEEELEGIDATVVPLRQRNSAKDSSVAPQPDVPQQVAVSNSDTPEQPIGNTASLPNAIFHSVVAIFNEALPGFLRDAVDPKAQEEYLYHALDDSIKSYLEQLSIDSARQCRNRWENEKQSLQIQMEAMRRKAQKDDEELQEAKKQQVSAERQKRALSERVHDLEKQIATKDAEIEQLDLEKKSLVNKLRLTDVIGGDALSPQNEALAGKVQELTAQLEESQTLYNTSLSEIASLKEALELSKAKDDAGNQMLSDLQSIASEAKERAAKLENQLSEANSRIEQLNVLSETLTADRDQLNDSLTSLQAEHKDISQRLQEAMENLEVVEQIQSQVAQLEESRRKNESTLRKQRDEMMSKDEQISELQAQINDFSTVLGKKDETISALEDLTDSLRKTIETNLYDHAQSQSALRTEIQRLKTQQHIAANPTLTDSSIDDSGALFIDENAASSSKAPQPSETDKNSSHPTNNGKKTPSKTDLKISAIDDSLEDTDWLIATPPPPSDKPREEDAEFGYKEPVRKITPDNPAQMELW